MGELFTRTDEQVRKAIAYDVSWDGHDSSVYLSPDTVDPWVVKFYAQWLSLSNIRAYQELTLKAGEIALNWGEYGFKAEVVPVHDVRVRRINGRDIVTAISPFIRYTRVRDVDDRSRLTLDIALGNLSSHLSRGLGTDLELQPENVRVNQSSFYVTDIFGRISARRLTLL